MNYWRTWISYLLLYLALVCSEPSYVPEEVALITTPVPVTFTYPSAMLRFVPWNFQKNRKIEIKFNTREKRGILFFVGSSSASNDCIGINIFNSNLYVYGILNAKEFRTQMNPPGTSVSNGRFYSVAIELLHTGHLTMFFQGLPNPETFQTPPILAFESYTYIGGIDSISRLPWLSYSQVGFAGCIEYIRVNDNQFVDVNKFAKQTEMQGVKTGVALTSEARCTPGLCDPGKCEERNYNTKDATKNFYCDCSGTIKTYAATAVDILRGEQCIRHATPFECDKRSFIFFDFEMERMTHTDDISLDFKTSGNVETLFFAKRKHGEDVTTFISADIVFGQVVVALKLQENTDEKYKKVFVVPKGGLGDGNWHTLKISRYVLDVMVYVDNVANNVTGQFFRPPGEKFYNRIRELYLGSNTAKAGTDKCSGTFKNFYWNEYDLLNTRNYLGRYSSQVITEKPKLPVLPPFPRQPPNPCAIKPNHQRTLVPNVPFNPNTAMFMIEFRTRYDGVIYYSDISNNIDSWLTVLIFGNGIVVPYKIGLSIGVIDISCTRGGINIRDNSWHRIVLELSKVKSAIIVFIDDVQELTKEVIFDKPFPEISEITFSVAGFSDSSQYYKVMSKLQENSHPMVASFSKMDDFKFVGCLGELLTNKDDFSQNMLSKSSVSHFPVDSVFCRACHEVSKCPRNYCQNNGQCYNINENSLSCNCTGTGFYGASCDIKNPTCQPSDCLNGGICRIFGSIKACNCSGTGYTGAQCEVSLCNNLLCQNNGICRLVNGQPICDCSATTFTGPYCDQTQCPKEFCLNNGQCKLDANARLPLCDCKGTGHTGIRCDNSICSPTQCNRNGNCVVRDDKAFCYCYDGYTGLNCQENVCTPNPCLNGGKCVSSLKQAVCSCSSDYEGERCEKPKRCPQGACLYGGACAMTNGRPICNCTNTDYYGPQCENPKSCPVNYCQNKGKCSVFKSNFVCDCSNTAHAGSQCTEKLGCPNEFCANGGLCSNTGGKFVCDCSQTGYSGDKCDQKSNGIMCPYYKTGYPVKMFKPPKLTDGMTTSMGFQTWVRTGSIFCYQTLDEKYWTAKLMDGKVVIDINGKMFNMRTKVNDGKYHVLKVTRDSQIFLVTLDYPVIETLAIPVLLTDITSLPANLIAYTKLIICNSCPDTESSNQFHGAIGGAKSGNDSIADQLNSHSVALIGPVTNTLVPLSPLAKPRAADFCSAGYCKNNGTCFIQNLRPQCDCGVSGYDGDKCDRKIFLVKSVPPDPGFVVHNMIPAVSSNFDLWKFLAMFTNSSSPLATFILSDGNYIEFRYDNGKISVLGSGVHYGNLNKIPLNLNLPHFFKIQNMLGRLTMYVNKTKTGAVTLPDNILMPNGSMKITRIIVGANKNLDDTLKGFLGGYTFNKIRLLFPNGSFLPTAARVRNIVIEPWIVIKKRALKLPDKALGSHGGIVYLDGKFVFADGFGAGAIVPTGSGPIILGQLISTAGGGLPISANGLVCIIVILLVISAIIWAIFYLGLCGFGKFAAIVPVPAMIESEKQTLLAAFPNSALFQEDFVTITPKSLRMDLNKTQAEFMSATNTMNGYHAMGDVSMSGGGYTMGGVRNGFATVGGAYTTGGGSAAYSTFGTGYAAGVGGGGGAVGGGVGGGGGFGGGGAGGYSSGVYLAQNFLTVPNQMSAQMNTNERSQLLNLSGQMNAFSGEEIKIESCILSEDSKFAVTGSVSGPPQMWDMSSGDLIRIMNGGDLTYTCIHLAQHNELLVGLVVENPQLSNMKRLTIWNFRTKEEIDFRDRYVCTTLCITSDSEKCVMADETRESAITIFNLKNEQSKKFFYNQPDTLMNERIQMLKISNNNQYVVAGCRSVKNTSLYMIFDIQAHRNEEPKIIDVMAVLQCCEFVNDTELVIGTESGELIVWDLGTAQPKRQIVITALLENDSKEIIKPHDNKINCIEVSKDRSIMVTGGSDSRVLVWEMNNETLRQRITDHEDEIQSVALTNDNEILVSGSWDGSIRMWNLNNGQGMCSFVSKIEITKVLISNDKTVIVALGEISGINKLVMLKVVRNVSKIVKTTHGDEIVSPPL